MDRWKIDFAYIFISCYQKSFEEVSRRYSYKINYYSKRWALVPLEDDLFLPKYSGVEPNHQVNRKA